MVNNFTPIDVQKFRKNNNLTNTILLLIATLTAFVLVILLFILLQRKTKVPVETNIQPTKMIEITPFVSPTNTSTPSAGTDSSIPIASPSGSKDISPTKTATGSSGVTP